VCRHDDSDDAEAIAKELMENRLWQANGALAGPGLCRRVSAGLFARPDDVVE